MSLPKDIRDQCWIETNGENFWGSCYVCHRKISIINFHVGHIVAREKGGLDCLENLLPICVSCNLAMKTTNLLAYKAKYYPSIGLKQIISSINQLPKSDIEELTEYMNGLSVNTSTVPRSLTPEPVRVKEQKEEKDKERDIRAERRNLEVTQPCKYVITKGPRVGSECGKTSLPGSIFCSVCIDKKNARIDPE